MTKAEAIKAHISKAQYYLELADKHQQLALAGEADAQSYDLHNGIEAMMDELDELMMEVCIPLEANTFRCEDVRPGNPEYFASDL